MGTCTVHSWNDGIETDDDFADKGRRLNAQLRAEDEVVEEDTTARTRQSRRRRAV
jgi:WD repeat-containing protein 23